MQQLPVMKGARIKKTLLWGLLATSAVTGSAVCGLWAAGEFNISNATPVAVERKQEVSQAARSFALQFAHEYFKWTVGQQDRREERLKPFLAQGMDPQAGLNFSNLTRHAVPEQISVWKEKMGRKKGEYVITISALVNFYDSKDTKKYFTKRMLLEVPVKEKSERDMAVVDNPRLVPLPAETSIQKVREPLEGEALDSSEKEALRSAAETFFKTYASGKQEELSYLMTGEQKVDTFQGKMQFKDIEQMEAVKKGDRVVSDLVVRLADPSTGMEVSVSYEIDWVKKDGRWFVESVQ